MFFFLCLFRSIILECSHFWACDMETHKTEIIHVDVFVVAIEQPLRMNTFLLFIDVM